jgi:hypothetical protein
MEWQGWGEALRSCQNTCKCDFMYTHKRLCLHHLFYWNWTINVENMDGNSFMPLHKMFCLLFQFTQNLESLTKFVWTSPVPSGKWYKMDENVYNTRKISLALLSKISFHCDSFYENHVCLTTVKNSVLNSWKCNSSVTDTRSQTDGCGFHILLFYFINYA